MDTATAKIENGSFEKDNQTYVLLQPAFLDNNYSGEAAYFAQAKKESDYQNDDAPTYWVEYEIIDGDNDDSGNHCDWDNPIRVYAE
jgi:hypothetical protein